MWLLEITDFFLTELFYLCGVIFSCNIKKSLTTTGAINKFNFYILFFMEEKIAIRKICFN